MIRCIPLFTGADGRSHVEETHTPMALRPQNRSPVIYKFTVILVPRGTPCHLFQSADHICKYSYSLRRVGFGKLYVIKPVFSIDCGGLDTPFLSYHFLTVKRFLM